MLNNYETVFILTPVLSDEQMKDAVKKFTKHIADLGGKIVNEENWGLKKLAYPIEGKKTGFYNLVEFAGPNDIISKLETEYRRDERIMRFLSVSLDKYAVAYNERRLKGFPKQKKKAKEEAAS